MSQDVASTEWEGGGKRELLEEKDAFTPKKKKSSFLIAGEVPSILYGRGKGGEIV